MIQCAGDTNFVELVKANTMDRKMIRLGDYDPTFLLHDDTMTRQLVSADLLVLRLDAHVVGFSLCCAMDLDVL